MCSIRDYVRSPVISDQWAVVLVFLVGVSQNPPSPRECGYLRKEFVFSRGSGVQRFRGSEVQGFRGSEVQGFRGSEVQGFRGSGVQGFRGSGVQGFRGSEVHGSGLS